MEIPLRLFFWCDRALTVEGSTFQVPCGLYIYPCFLNTSPTKVLLMPCLLVNMSCPAQHDSEQRLISQSLVKVRKPRFGLEEGCSQYSEQAAVQSKESCWVCLNFVSKFVVGFACLLWLSLLLG